MFGISAFSESPFASLPDSFVLTGEQINTSVGTVTVIGEVNSGWGRFTWGQGPWGEDLPVELTGQDLTTVLNSVTIAIQENRTVLLTGEELVHTLESNIGVSAGGSIQIPASEEVELNLSLNSVTVLGTGNVSLTGENLTTVLNSVTALGNANVSITGENLTLTEGTVDPSPDANVTGQQLTSTLNSVVVDISAVGIVTGQLLSTSLASVSIDLNTVVNVTGQNLTTSLASVTTKLDVDVNVTGLGLTGTTGQLYSTAWAAVDTGASSVWTPVNTAA